MQPHQQRVVAEESELYEKIGKLSLFLQTGMYSNLPEAEQDRLSRQLGHMQAYHDVLKERIGAFEVA